MKDGGVLISILCHTKKYKTFQISSFYAFFKARFVVAQEL
jgi:hypothetical protein